MKGYSLGVLSYLIEQVFPESQCCMQSDIFCLLKEISLIEHKESNQIILSLVQSLIENYNAEITSQSYSTIFSILHALSFKADLTI